MSVDLMPEMSVKDQLEHARFQIRACESWIKTKITNEHIAQKSKMAKTSIVFWQNQAIALEAILDNEKITMASRLRIGHSSSMSYRIWYYGCLDNTLKFRETHWGTKEQVLSHIRYFKAVRVDAYDIEFGWATVWLTSKEFLSLNEGGAL